MCSYLHLIQHGLVSSFKRILLLREHWSVHKYFTMASGSLLSLEKSQQTNLGNPREGRTLSETDALDINWALCKWIYKS